MAVKDKVRLRKILEGLYPSVAGFSNERLDVLAARLESTDESADEEISTELTTINDTSFQTFEQIKKEDDRVRNLEGKLNKVKNARRPIKTQDGEDPSDEDPSDEDPVAKVLKEMAELKATLAEKEAQEKRQSLANRFKQDERLKGIPSFLVNRAVPTSEDEYDEAVETLAAEFKEFATEHKLESFGKDAPPAGKAPKFGGKVEISKDEADKLAGRLLGNQ